MIEEPQQSGASGEDSSIGGLDSSQDSQCAEVFRSILEQSYDLGVQEDHCAAGENTESAIRPFAQFTDATLLEQYWLITQEGEDLAGQRLKFYFSGVRGGIRLLILSAEDPPNKQELQKRINKENEVEKDFFDQAKKLLDRDIAANKKQLALLTTELTLRGIPIKLPETPEGETWLEETKAGWEILNQLDF